MGYRTANSEPWANLCVPSLIAALLCDQTGLVLSCHLEEELLLENRCENSRSKISKIPRSSLMSRFEIHRASDAGASFGSFPHSRTAFLILPAEGQEIFEGMSFAS
jgi:hypothetical protein